MTYPYFQLIIYSDTPYEYAFQKGKDGKQTLISFTIQFLRLLHLIDQKPTSYTIQLAFAPIFYEILDQPEFQQQVSEHFVQKKMEQSKIYQVWKQAEYRINSIIRKLINENKIELLASPATFSTLPYLATSTGIDLQVKTGLSILEDYFEVRPKGFWFPRGAYASGLDLNLASTGIQYSYIDQSTIINADPTPKSAQFPVESPHGLVFFPLLDYIVEENENWKKRFHFLIEEVPTIQEQSVLSVAFNFEQVIENIEDILASISSLMDENFITPMNPQQYLNTMNNQMEMVHLSSSFMEGFDDEHSFSDDEKSQLFIESYFLEMDLEKYDYYTLSSNEKRLYKQMQKEWMLLSGLISNRHFFPTKAAKEYIDAYKTLSTFFSKPLVQEWLVTRENKFPVLTSTYLLDSTKKAVKSNNKKKILLLSWEYPPHIVGGLGKHVHGLSNSLAGLGYDIHIVTARRNDSELEEIKDSIYIHRVHPLNELDQDFLKWIGGLNLAILEKGIELAKTNSFELIHAHEWLVGAAALSLQEQLNIPLITTIHATEYGRNNGIHNEMQRFIHEKEKLLINGSNFIIVCSEFMKEELIQVFHINESKLFMIPNGVSEQEIWPTSEVSLSNIPVNQENKLVFCVGRMVKEKGFDTLIEAASKIKAIRPDVYFIIAGTGPMLNDYRQKVVELHLEDCVYFIGYISDEQRNALYSICDMAIVPSLYEPFGITALESMIFAKPTIVSSTGGLKGIVENAKSGLYMVPGSSDSLIEQVIWLLENNEDAIQIGRKGKEAVEKLFNWSSIAEETKRVFEEARTNYKI
ncbi:glycosyltransferase [Bacillus sp. 03113]|uniref:glycosyltransferase n=1 Tax=Bacillus sp. 03113 TaxID=2578211 RepID=UPI0011447373|nr:glycosyltransferase [Bacillus sp. 03113]